MEGTDAEPGVYARTLEGLFRLFAERAVDWAFEVHLEGAVALPPRTTAHPLHQIQEEIRCRFRL